MNLGALVKTAIRVCSQTVPVVLLTLFVTSAAARATPASAPWLVISDVHYDPFAHGSEPSPLSRDTNGALLDSLLAELKRAYPAPPVVFISGDFLAHNFHKNASAKTMVYLARRFNGTFPNAQFVIALGNNDSDCGDYEISLGGTFLHAVALAWAPLVNRHGAAPSFVASFSRDGGYSASLPRVGLRAVVLNDVYDTLRYSDACGQHANPAATSLSQLAKTLEAEPKGDKNWLIMHVPPGIDAFSTAHLAHRLLVVPFLRSGARERLLGLVNDPRNRMTLVIAGHTHKFAYRLSNAGSAHDVPLLLAPSVSPIFLNTPSFLSFEVGPSAAVGNVVETSYVDGRWQRTGDLASLGVPRFDARSLEGLQRRLPHDAALRDRFARLYSGAGVRDITEQNWKTYWCAATELSANAFGRCASEGGYGVFTGRALRIGGLLLGGVLLGLSAIFFVIRRRRSFARRA